MIYFPPDNLHGKQLKMWYRGKMQALFGTYILPDGWQDHVGLEVKMVPTLVLVHPKPYEKWDMQDELVGWGPWKFRLHA